jgi:hypothetical protein
LKTRKATGVVNTVLSISQISGEKTGAMVRYQRRIIVGPLAWSTGSCAEVEDLTGCPLRA